MKQAPLIQEDWELDLTQGLPVSRLTVQVKWPRLVTKLSGLVRASCAGPARIIDVGGGQGGFFDEVQDQCASYLVVEPSKTLLERFTARQKKYAYRGFGEELPCPADCADVVLIKAALDHCFDPQKVLSEAFRVLSEHGTVLVLLTNDGAWYKRIFSRQNALRKERCSDHNFFFTVDQVAELLKRAGFQQVQSYDYDYLRIPVPLENLMLQLFPARLIASAMDCLDALGTRIWPQGGGSFICRAAKGGGSRCGTNQEPRMAQWK